MSDDPVFNWPASGLEPVRLETTGPVAVKADDLSGEKEGWAQYRKGVRLLSKSAADLGDLLHAEWCDGKGENLISHRIYTDASGKLQHIRISESDDGAAYFRQHQSIHGAGEASGKMLTYHIYWQDQGDGALNRVISAFAGLSKIENSDTQDSKREQA